MRATLNGIVSSDENVEIYRYWGYSAFSPQDVRTILAENPDGEELIFEINSPGGSVLAGSEIYTVIRSAGNVKTRAEVQSLAASAASYFALACGEVWISPVAQMMIHLPATWTEGDRTDHLQSVQMLDTIRESIINAYELKAGGKADRAEFRRMMTANTWLTAQEAVEKGLADGILFQEEAVPQNVMNALGSGIRALGCSGGMPDIVQLRAEYARRNPPAPAEAPGATETAGAAPVANNQDWQLQARLDLEKIRF